jgi:hypothetical protein
MTILDLMTVAGVSYVGVSLFKMLIWDPNSEIKQISGSVPLWYDLKSSTISVDRGQVVWNARLARGLPYTSTIIKSMLVIMVLDNIHVDVKPCDIHTNASA